MSRLCGVAGLRGPGTPLVGNCAYRYEVCSNRLYEDSSTIRLEHG